MPGPGEINYYKIMIDATDGVGLITILQLTSLHLFMLISKEKRKVSFLRIYFTMGCCALSKMIGIVKGEGYI